MLRAMAERLVYASIPVNVNSLNCIVIGAGAIGGALPRLRGRRGGNRGVLRPLRTRTSLYLPDHRTRPYVIPKYPRPRKLGSAPQGR